jgi:hypothetical protein
MEKILWYCPRCDCETMNWRKCSRCKGDAVLQRFILWAVSPAEQSMQPTPRRRSGSARSRVRKSKVVLPAQSG